MMRWAIVVAAGALALSLLGTASATPLRRAGTLPLAQATLAGRVNQVPCPPNVDPAIACFDSTTSGLVRGLGAVTETNLNFVEDPDSSCERWHSNPVLTVGGKGKLELEVNPSGECNVPTSGVLTATLPFIVTGGSGMYAGASGSGTFKTNGTPGTANRETDILNGSVTIPGVTFDLTSPVISGARSKTVVVAKGAAAARVHFAVKARDGGRTVPVTCRPRSGSRFKVGRTRVRCRAVDDSGNVAAASFDVVVRRGH